MSVSVAETNCLCVDCLSLCLLVLVISFCVLRHGLTIFLDMGQTESTPLNTLVNHWREVRERGENLSVVVKKGKFSYSLLHQMAHLQSRLATHRYLGLAGDHSSRRKSL